MLRTVAWLIHGCGPGLLLLAAAGCSSPLFRAQSPDNTELNTLTETPEERTKYIGDLAIPWGEKWLKVEGVALVTQLDGTGSDPPPSPLLDQLKREMQTHEARGINETLASKDTAMVLVGGYMPPGAEKGDTFDVLVSVPPRAGVSSLRGGWLMPTRLRQVLMVDRQLHTGDVAALAQGELLVDALFNKASDDAVAEQRARVLGGGVVTKPRPFGLGIYDEHASVRTSAMVGAAINDRFHHFHRGEKSGVAKPLRDNQVELSSHPKYKHNFTRYLRVILNIAVSETPAERSQRLVTLDRMLQEPTTAERAAVQLEAIGPEAIPILRRGVAMPDAEVRFYAAEALAYLDEPLAAEPLFEAALGVRAFRWRALAALSALEHVSAREALAQLMNSPSAETRYGAFRALRMSDANDPCVRGQVLGKSFGYHVVGTTAEPMVHFSRSRRPEIVLFGHEQRLRPPAFLFAGRDILIKRVDQDHLKISRFQPNEETEQVVCSTSVDEVIGTIVDLGGGYQEILTALTTAKENGYLDSRVEIAALPSQRRVYRREDQPAGEPRYHVTNPVPEMFSEKLDAEPDSPSSADAEGGEQEPGEESREGSTERGWFARMFDWFPDGGFGWGPHPD